MRIAIDARYVADHFPGIGRYVFNLARALTELDQPHTLLVLHNPALTNTRYDMAALARTGSVELVAASARPLGLAEHVLIPRLLGRLQADLYHAPYYVRPCFGLPCPSVVTLYDAIPRLFPAEVSPRARLLFDLLTRLAARASRRVIAISTSGRDDLAAAYRIPAGKFAVTPLAADEQFRPPSPQAVARVRKTYDLPERYVLSLSSNKPHKNLTRLVEAWAIVEARGWRGESCSELSWRHLQASNPKPLLVVAGHWDARYPEARQLAERLGLQQLRFVHNVAEEDLPALYGGAEVFAYPSLYEGFGLPPLEAMACGTPVLCGAGSSLPEVVGDAALLADVRSAEALAHGLARLLGDAGLRERLSDAGLGRAARFSWGETARATLRVYEESKIQN